MQTFESNSDEIPTECIIRIANLDTPIYRIISLWNLEDMVRQQRTVLVQPKRWDDPLEVIECSIAVNFSNGHQKIINQTLPPIYAQCWSFTEESDTLLRAYSRVVKDAQSGRNIFPRDEGVRIRSTPRKLLNALRRGIPPHIFGNWFIGAVKYLGRQDLLQELANSINFHGLDVFNIHLNRAMLLLLKRDAFSHEAEVRVTFLQNDNICNDETLSIPIDPNKVFDEITFDPRLTSFERIERESLLRSLGYSEGFGVSSLYQKTLLEIVLPIPYLD